MSASTTAILFRKPPYGNAIAKEALELVLALGAFDQSTDLYFLDEGVLQLIEAQDPAPHKNQINMIKALPLYGIEALFVEQESLAEQGVTEQQLANITVTISRAEMKTKLSRYQKVISL